MDESDGLMHGLKHKADHIKGRCRVCRYRDLCTGSMRVRGFRTYDDPWAPDPQCYISDQEIGLDDEMKIDLSSMGEEFPMPEQLLGNIK